MAKDQTQLLALQDISFVVEVEPKAWERQNYEPHFWYQVFWRHYVAAGLTRTLKKAFSDFFQEKFKQTDEDIADLDVPNQVPKLWHDAFEAWNWEDRAVLWDEDVSYQRNLSWAERQHELREKEWEVSQKLLSLAQDTLEAWLKKFTKSIEERGKAPELRFVDIERAVNMASRIGRLSAGLATENTNITADLTIKARDIESVRKKRWANHQIYLNDIDDENDPTIIEGELANESV